MRLRGALVAALAAALTGMLPGSAGATHEHRYEPTTTRFYMRNGGGCPGDPFLRVTPGSGEPACGYTAGLPYGELYQSGAPMEHRMRTYATRDGTPQFLDPSRDVRGNVRVVATAQTERMAVGQIRVDVTVRATTEGGEGVELGTHSSETIVDPTSSAEVDFPFTIDLDGLSGLDRVGLGEVAVVVDIRGWHVLTGFHRLNGRSWLDLPGYLRTPIQH